MSTPTESKWLASVHRLRERLEQVENRHRMVMAELKDELSTLEKRLPITEESPPEPIIEKPAPEPPWWNELEDKILPSSAAKACGVTGRSRN